MCSRCLNELQLVAERENASLFMFYHKTFEEAQAGFKTNQAEAIHGSLLTIGIAFARLQPSA
jgi:hypothetical protein